MTQKTRMVIAHLQGGKLIKGYLNHLPEEHELDFILRHHLVLNGARLPIAPQASGPQVELDLDTLKALFFVRSFEGRKEYQEIKFFGSHPAVAGLWVQVEFADGEVTEGILQNSLRFLTEPGFLLKPPDPLSNNEFVYVPKKSLKDFRVLGVRDSY